MIKVETLAWIENFLPDDDVASDYLSNDRYNLNGDREHVHEFSNVLMLNQIQKRLSVICKDEMTIAQETMNEHLFWNPQCIFRYYLKSEEPEDIRNEIQRRRSSIEESLKHAPKKSVRLEGTYIDLTHTFGMYVYGHMFDTLRRLYCIQDIVKDPSVKFIVSDQRRIVDFRKHLSIMCGREILKEDMILSNVNRNFEIDRLHYAVSPTIYVRFDKSTYRWMLKKYYQYFGITRPKPIYDLYLDRNDVRKGRGVSNNKEVMQFLQDRGFKILNGKESIETMIHLFSHARTIVAAHGSMLANTIFSNPWTKIVEYCPDNRPDRSLMDQYKMAQDYIQVRLPGDDAYNIHIDLDRLTKDLTAA